MPAAEADVVHATAMAKRDDPVGIDPILTDTVLRRDLQHRRQRRCPWSGAERFGRSAPSERPVRSHAVVVGAEAIELRLQLGERSSRPLLGEPALERLVEPLDLPAGLRVIGP
jgi:hypothetical protein